jgi:hypothetical protein
MYWDDFSLSDPIGIYGLMAYSMEEALPEMA